MNGALLNWMKPNQTKPKRTKQKKTKTTSFRLDYHNSNCVLIWCMHISVIIWWIIFYAYLVVVGGGGAATASMSVWFVLISFDSIRFDSNLDRIFYTYIFQRPAFEGATIRFVRSFNLKINSRASILLKQLENAHHGFSLSVKFNCPHLTIIQMLGWKFVFRLTSQLPNIG